MAGTILEALARRGAPLAQKLAPSAGAGLSSWSSVLADNLVVYGYPQGADAVRKAGSALDKDTPAGFAAILSYFVLEQEDEAKLAWLANAGDFDSIMAALDEADRSRVADEAAREAAWSEVRSVALQLVEDEARVAIPLLLSIAMSGGL